MEIKHDELASLCIKDLEKLGFKVETISREIDGTQYQTNRITSDLAPGFSDSVLDEMLFGYLQCLRTTLFCGSKLEPHFQIAARLLDEFEMREREFQKVKDIIKANFIYAKHGIFFESNTVGDSMSFAFKGEFFAIKISRNMNNFEIFGCSNLEQDELEHYYKDLKSLDI